MKLVAFGKAIPEERRKAPTAVQRRAKYIGDAIDTLRAAYQGAPYTPLLGIHIELLTHCTVISWRNALYRTSGVISIVPNVDAPPVVGAVLDEIKRLREQSGGKAVA